MGKKKPNVSLVFNINPDAIKQSVGTKFYSNGETAKNVKGHTGYLRNGEPYQIYHIYQATWWLFP